MSLAKTLEEIKKLQPFAEEDVDSGPLETMRARRGRKAQAIESLKTLKRDYSKDLLRSAAFILVLGDKREEFATLASEHYKCFQTDPNTFFTDLANRIPETLYMGKEGISNVFDIVSRHLEDKALDLDIVGYNQLVFKQQYRRTINTKEDFYALVREAVTEQIGGELVGIQAVRSILNSAIERNYAAKVTPILLPVSDEKFALTVANDLGKLTNKVIVVTTGKITKALKAHGNVLSVKEVSQESVEKAMANISALVKP